MTGGVLAHEPTMFEALGTVDLGIAPTLAPGEHLRRARVARGLSLADIARRTRSSEHHLAAIERWDFAAFQGRVYALGCARSYARAVEVDEAVVVTAVGSAYRTAPSRAPFLAEPLLQPRRGRPSWMLYRMAGAMLATLIGCAVLQALTRG